MYNKLTNFVKRINSLEKIKTIEICTRFSNNYLPSDKFDLDNKLSCTIDENLFYLNYDNINLVFTDTNNLEKIELNDNNNCIDFEIKDDTDSVFITIEY